MNLAPLPGGDVPIMRLDTQPLDGDDENDDDSNEEEE